MRIPVCLCLLFGLLSAALVSAGRPGRRDTTSWTGPLSTRGRYVVDAIGNRFKLRSGNWHGGSGTYSGSGDINDDANHHAGENAHTMPLGLQYVPIDQIIDSFVELGVNTIRLQFSNQMIHDTTIINSTWVAANPQFEGMTPLQVYDAVVQALTDRGIAVILNNHTDLSLWCCGIDGNERWDESQSYDTWVADWVFMVARYAANKRVVGADLYNEVRRDVLTDPNWGNGDDADWHQASQLASDQILLTNPDVLVIVEGINWIGLPVDGVPHSRPTLIPVALLSHTPIVPHKLVYSAHFYSYTGPNHSGATGIGETSDPRYRDLSRDDLFAVLNSSASYVALDSEMHYTSPVWISEFGMEGRADTLPADIAFWQNFIDYLVETDADYAFWPLVGYLNNGVGNGWSLMNWATVPGGAPRVGLFDGNDWRAPAWEELVSGVSATGQVAVVPEWRQLQLDHGDFIQSLYARQNLGDWDNGATKAQCPDTLRLIGLSHGSTRGLCTDVGLGPALWASSRATEVVFDERHVTTDWASGYTKYTCPPNYFVSGWAIRGTKLSTVMCAAASVTLGTSSARTVWFDQGDNRADQLGGDFANGQFKGSCATNEYIAGVAFTTRLFASPVPAAIWCVAA